MARRLAIFHKLARLANALDLPAKRESKYNRLQRFLKDAPLDFEIFARLLLALVKPAGKYALA